MASPPTHNVFNDWGKKAEKELGETEEAKQEGLAKLRELIKDKKLKTIERDDFLLRFLRARKFQPEKALKLLENHLAVRRSGPGDLFSVREALKEVDLFEEGWQCVLPGRDLQGRAIFVFRPGQYNLVSDKSKSTKGRVTVDQSFRMNFLSMEWSLLEAETQIRGLTAVVDLAGFSLLKHSAFLSPYHSRRTSAVVQDTIPIRFGGFHVVNQPRYMDTIYALFRPFLKEKIRERVYFHGSELSRLQDHMSPSVLPPELGGTAPSLVSSDWTARLLARTEDILVPTKVAVAPYTKDHPSERDDQLITSLTHSLQKILCEVRQKKFSLQKP